MVLGIVVDFWGLISRRGGVAFLLGVLQKVVCRTWFFDGELWWMRGELWCVDGRILGFENFPLFRDLFLRGGG
jgi:hypothetical protein